MAEHRFYLRLPASVADRVRGKRYADDGVAAIREWPGVATAAELFQLFATSCYPAPLELEVEKHDGQFNLLESTVYQVGEHVAVFHRQKNWSETDPAGTAKYRVWTGRGSWGEKRRGLLIGLLTRAYRNCSRRSALKSNIVLILLRACVESQVTGVYCWRQLLHSLYYMSTKRPTEETEWL